MTLSTNVCPADTISTTTVNVILRHFHCCLVMLFQQWRVLRGRFECVTEDGLRYDE